jgi:hypothetical protein
MNQSGLSNPKSRSKRRNVGGPIAGRHGIADQFGLTIKQASVSSGMRFTLPRGNNLAPLEIK